MKEPCLSVRQPYAWAIVVGLKDIENRSWSTRFRGRLLIHASQQIASKAGIEQVRRLALAAGVEMPDVMSLPRGVVVGSVDVADIMRPEQTPSPWVDASAEACWVLRDARCEPFVPLRGMVGIFDAARPAVRRELKTSECLGRLAG